MTSRELGRRPVLQMLGAGLAAVGLPSAARAQDPVAQPGSLTFRWFNNAGFELVLPSGAHLLIDPWLDSAAFNPFPAERLERADYILISHIHGDHSDDVGKIQQRFRQVRTFVGNLSAEPLIHQQNLDTSAVFKVSDGQEFDFGEVKITAFAGRHTESSRGNFLRWEENGRLTTASWGTLDLYQYLVTIPGGLKFLVWAGTPSIDNAYRLAGIAPDVVAVHISPKQDFTILGEILKRMDPRVVIPHHYDIWPSILRQRPEESSQFPTAVQPVTPDDVIERMMPYVESTLTANGMPGRFFVPQNHRWYRYSQASGEVAPA